MDKRTDLQQLRRQRNRYAFGAIFMLVTSIGVCLPRAIHRRDELKASNDQLLQLQEEIRQTQTQTSNVQQEILRCESELKKALGTG